MKWHLTQLGSREKYLYPRIINNKGRVGSFSTDMWFRGINNLPLSGKYARLKSKWHPDLDSLKVNSRNTSSLYRMFRPYSEKTFDLWVKQGEVFGNWAAKKIQKVGGSVDDYFFGYACSSLEVAKLAKIKGAKMVLGQYDPGLYWYEIQRKEAKKWLGSGEDIYLPTKKFEERIRMEWELSDIILVNSSHSKEALKAYGVDEEKIKILPLVAPNNYKNEYYFNKNISQKIKILFVGNISFAKGFPYFAEAQKILKDDTRFEFYAIGDVHIPRSIIEKHKWNINFTGRLNQQELSEFYSSSHLLVFPTLSEGFGQVQLEAMSHGLPVIATRNCGDVVIDKFNGKSIDICNSEEIVNAILELVDDEKTYSDLSENALKTTHKFSFSNIETQFWEIFE